MVVLDEDEDDEAEEDAAGVEVAGAGVEEDEESDLVSVVAGVDAGFSAFSALPLSARESLR